MSGLANPNASEGAGYGTPIYNPSGVVNPNATAGAGRGVPIGTRERDAFLGMQEFMRRTGEHQSARNLQTEGNARSGPTVSHHRQTNLPPAVFNNTRRNGARVGHEPLNRHASPPFALLSFNIPDVGAPKVYLNKGYVVEVITSASGDDGLIVHDVTVNEAPMGEADDPTELEVNFNDYVYVKFETDDFGNITDPPEILITAAEQDTIHYQPTDSTGASGVDGVYYFRLGQLTGSGASNAEWVSAINSDIFHYHELWTGRTIGGSAHVYKRRNPDNDTYEFRGLDAGGGISMSTGAAAITVSFDGTNIGSANEVYAGSGGPATFRTLRELNSGELTSGIVAAQIKVATVDNNIRIRGNNYQASLAWIDVQDGLVTNVTDPTNADGLTCDVLIRDCDGDPFAEPPVDGTIRLRMSFESGILVSVNATEGSRALAETVHTAYLQSCHWVDDIPHSHA